MILRRHFKAAVILSIITRLMAVAAEGQGTNRIQSLAELRERLAAHLAEPRFAGATWGVKVESLETGRILYENHAERLMSPASNSKLYTAALALDTLGGDYQIATPIYATAKPNRFGTIHGNLIIVGRGDPSWNARRLGTNFWDVFEPFVRVLTNAGVRRIKGDLVADATYFRGPPTGSSWTADDLQEYYGASISAISLEDNYCQVHVQPGASPGEPCNLTLLQPDTGLVLSNRTVTASSNGVEHVEWYRPLGGAVLYVSGQLPLADPGETLDVPVPDPAKWFAAGLKQALARHGVKVSGKARSLAWPQPSGWQTARTFKLGEVHSPPLREVVRSCLKVSQNLEVDLLLASLGEMLRPASAPPWETSEQSGLAALRRFLSAAGLPADEVHFDEGSGLSRNNLTTANATVALLQYMATNRCAEDFINSLPVAGRDGTLRHRMRNTPAEGNVRAKTGTLRWANSLSGYVTSAAGEHLAFSVMLNRYVATPEHEARDQLDKIAVLLAELGERTVPKRDAWEQPPKTIQTPPMNAPPVQRAPVKLGVDVLFEKRLDLIRGKRVGLITNPAGVNSRLDSVVERFREQPDVKLVALYGPEHGARGNAQAGQFVPYYFDEHYQLPVFSLYGQNERPPADMLTNIDQYMRSFDTDHKGKAPDAGMVQAVDVMVFDLQDVGTRVYTYIATMAYAMQVCAESGIPFVVLDRPNPINGVAMEGPVLEYPQYSSFIGLYPIPLRHGMTAGELALLFNERFLPQRVALTVVPMENWHRDEWLDQTGLPWVMPSPNLPTLGSATVYPGQVMLEGTNLSEGRGTTRPFELFGAPWIDGYVLAGKLNALRLPGVKFREAWFTPSFSKYQGQLCGGCQLHVLDRNAYQAVSTTLAVLSVIRSLYPDHFQFHAEYFDKVLGTATVREALESGASWMEIVSRFKQEIQNFARLRKPFLLYR